MLLTELEMFKFKLQFEYIVKNKKKIFIVILQN